MGSFPEIPMGRFLRQGDGWRIGWDPDAATYRGLVGSDTWSLELTGAELDDFCRLSAQLANTLQQMAGELMDEEAIACEVESELLWLEAQGYPDRYRLHLIVLNGRRGEGYWEASAVLPLLDAIRLLKGF